MLVAQCSIEGCDSPVKARSWCSAHYARWFNHGDPLGGRKTMNGEPERYFREVVLTYDGDECLIWPFGKFASGYGTLNSQTVHRRVCEQTNGPPPSSRHEAAHECGQYGCVAKRHLSWKTPKENQADKILHGTHNRGERCPTAKLTEAQAREIIGLRGVVQQRELANRFGVSVGAVANVACGRTWSWLRCN